MHKGRRVWESVLLFAWEGRRRSGGWRRAEEGLCMAFWMGGGIIEEGGGCGVGDS